MALVSSVLASGLAALVPAQTEAEAVTRIVDAWDAYFAGASVNGIPAVSGSYAAGLTAMQGALSGISVANAGAQKLQDGILAFWNAIVGLAPSIWITAPVVLVPPAIAPPGISGIAAALTPVFASNTSSNADLVTATNSIATVLHTNGGLGGLVNGSVPPASPVPIPIL